MSIYLYIYFTNAAADNLKINGIKIIFFFIFPYCAYFTVSTTFFNKYANTLIWMKS